MTNNIEVLRGLVAAEIERAMWNHGVRLTPSQKHDAALAAQQQEARNG